MRFIIRRTVAQIVHTEFAHQAKILAPMLVMSAQFHLVNALFSAVAPDDRRVAVFDSRAENKFMFFAVSRQCLFSIRRKNLIVIYAIIRFVSVTGITIKKINEKFCSTDRKYGKIKNDFF